MSSYHIPVMLKESLQYLQVQPGAWYIDANLGGGGHTAGIIQAGGKVLGIDLDPESIREVAKNHQLKVEVVDDHLEAISTHLILYQSNFAHMEEIVKKLHLDKVLGVLFDLGVSSHQLEQPQRGFSFNLDAPLDMRMDPQHMSVTAADLVNALHVWELKELIQNLGEENYALKIAKRIVEERKKQPIKTSNQLAQIITSTRPRSKADRTHPATRTFQALRIAVNDELNSLKVVLPQALNVLAPEGRLVVLSFHSLEDKIVKNFFKDEHKKKTVTILTQKPLSPSEEEVEDNPRSRSGKLRAIQKI